MYAAKLFMPSGNKSNKRPIWKSEEVQKVIKNKKRAYKKKTASVTENEWKSYLPHTQGIRNDELKAYSDNILSWKRAMPGCLKASGRQLINSHGNSSLHLAGERAFPCSRANH